MSLLRLPRRSDHLACQICAVCSAARQALVRKEPDSQHRRQRKELVGIAYIAFVAFADESKCLMYIHLAHGSLVPATPQLPHGRY